MSDASIERLKCLNSPSSRVVIANELGVRGEDEQDRLLVLAVGVGVLLGDRLSRWVVSWCNHDRSLFFGRVGGERALLEISIDFLYLAVS